MNGPRGENCIRWSTFAEAAQELFDVWVDRPELGWAQKSWKHLETAGLTSYTNDLERTLVMIRFVALAAFYHSWCHAAWQEGSVELVYWSDALELSRFRLAQLVGVDFEADIEDTDDGLFEEALSYLVDQEYQCVVETLLNASGGASGLFMALWLSRDAQWAGQEEIPKDLQRTLVNDVEDDKMVAFNWISNGCPMST